MVNLTEQLGPCLVLWVPLVVELPAKWEKSRLSARQQVHLYFSIENPDFRMLLFVSRPDSRCDPRPQEFLKESGVDPEVSPLTLLADTQAAFQLLQGDGPVLVQVTVVDELAGTFLGFGFLLQVSLQGLELLLVYVVAAVVIQLGKVPVHHPFLQSVTGVRFSKPEES